MYIVVGGTAPLGLDAAEAAFRVGYASPSQFGQEYRRLLGAPPLQDIAQPTATS